MASTRSRWTNPLAATALPVAAVIALGLGTLAGPSGSWAAGSVRVDQAANAPAQPPAQRPAQSPAQPPAQPAGAPQVLGVTVRGAGLEVSPAHLTVTLQRSGHSDHFSGDYGPLTVVDARGTLRGWTAFLSVTGSPDAEVEIHPGSPVVVSGIRSEVRVPRSANLAHGQAVIMCAPAGGGGGTFADSGTLTLDSRSITGGTVTIQLSVSAADVRV